MTGTIDKRHSSRQHDDQREQPRDHGCG